MSYQEIFLSIMFFLRHHYPIYNKLIVLLLFLRNQHIGKLIFHTDITGTKTSSSFEHTSIIISLEYFLKQTLFSQI